MKGEGKSSRRLTQVDAAGGETSVCVVTGLLYPQGESGAAATEKTRVLRVGCRAGIKIARGGRFVPSSPCYRLKLTGPLRPVHISIPALRAEGDFFEPDGQGIQQISIHTLRMEGDRVRLQQRGPRNISTHALHIEGDPERTGWSCPANKDFYPRPRVEGDRRPAFGRISLNNFYPRPRVEGDGSRWGTPSTRMRFLPTPSRRGRRSPCYLLDIVLHFLSTPSRRGRPGTGTFKSSASYFYPRPRVEGDGVSW